MQARERENERRDWIIILLIILLGFLCVIVAGQWAVRFSPSWKLDTDMGSNLNPNSEFLTGIPNSDVAPIDPAILTPPSWLNFFLTPGAAFKTNTPIPTKTNTPTATSTAEATSTSTATFAPTATPTLFVMYITSTPKPPSTGTETPTRTPTATPTTTPASTVTNTPTATLTSTPTDTPTSTPTNTPTDTPTPIGPIPVDLSITKDDFVSSYTPGNSLPYTIVVTNNSIFAVNGATVTDIFPAQIANASWICTPGSGATCTLSGTGNINDIVNLPAGLSVTYTVNATTSTFAAGTLSNTASVAVPAGFTETTPGNNTATDSDAPPGGTEPNIGPPNGSAINPGPGGSITLAFSPAIIANGDVGTPDFVYYEILSSQTTIDLDAVKIEISIDGITWIQVFNWGNNIRDTNTNVDTNIISPDPTCTVNPPECDNRRINTSELYPYPGTGIAIDIDSIPGISPGASYAWIMISGNGGIDGPNIDAIEILP